MRELGGIWVFKYGTQPAYTLRMARLSFSFSVIPLGSPAPVEGLLCLVNEEGRPAASGALAQVSHQRHLLNDLEWSPNEDFKSSLLVLFAGRLKSAPGALLWFCLPQRPEVHLREVAGRGPQLHP